MDDINQMILEYLQTIPKGKVTTYKALAQRFGVHPRKVSMTMKYNKSPDIFPCYKVIASNRSLSGYNTAGGVDDKRARLEKDGVEIVDGKIDEKFII